MGKPRFTDSEFLILLDLLMVSDPWPLTDDDELEYIDMLRKEAISRGYSDEVAAYHEFTLKEKP